MKHIINLTESLPCTAASPPPPYQVKCCVVHIHLSYCIMYFRYKVGLSGVFLLKIILKMFLRALDISSSATKYLLCHYTSPFLFSIWNQHAIQTRNYYTLTAQLTQSNPEHPHLLQTPSSLNTLYVL